MTSKDNIFIDGINNYIIKPHINGLSDHNAHLLTLEDSDHTNYNNETIHIRNINDRTTAEFQYLLSREQWEDVFGTSDVNIMFNNFFKNLSQMLPIQFYKKKICIQLCTDP